MLFLAKNWLGSEDYLGLHQIATAANSVAITANYALKPHNH